MTGFEDFTVFVIRLAKGLRHAIPGKIHLGITSFSDEFSNRQNAAFDLLTIKLWYRVRYDCKYRE
jgi:hypothetical protein